MFFLLFCKRRKMIPAGFLAVCCLLFFLSGRVWNVEIRGNILNPTPQLMSFLKEQGVCFGVSRKKISCSALAASLRREFPEITWVSAGFSGTGLRFEIREGTAGEKAEPEEKSLQFVFNSGRCDRFHGHTAGNSSCQGRDEIKKARNWFPGSWTSPMTARRSSAMHMFRQMRIFTSDIPLPITIPFRWT